jgi:hypothetical protein
VVIIIVDILKIVGMVDELILLNLMAKNFKQAKYIKNGRFFPGSLLIYI